MTDSFETIGPYEIHPHASVWPMLAPDAFEALKADIARDGQHYPIMLTSDGRLVADGRNRLKACVELGIAPKFGFLPPDWTAEQIDDFIISANKHRRHSTAEQCAEAARLIYAAQKKFRAETFGMTIEQAARACGVSIMTVKRMKALAERRPDLHAKVLARELSISTAYDMLMGYEPKAAALPDHLPVAGEPAAPEPPPEPRQEGARTRETLPAPVPASRPPAPIQRPAPIEGELIPPASEPPPTIADYWRGKLEEARAERDAAFDDRARAEAAYVEMKRQRDLLMERAADLERRMNAIEATTPPPATGRRVF